MKKLCLILVLLCLAHSDSGYSQSFSAPYYAFAPQAPGGTLTGSTPATVTMTPCGLGMSGSNANYYVYVSGGTGTAEAALITGGTCTSGASSGTLTFTPANNHSGAWTVGPATSGIQEAYYAAVTTSTNPLNSVSIKAPAGKFNIYAPINFNDPNNTIRGVSFNGEGPNTILERAFTSGDLLIIGGTSSGAAIQLGNFLIETPTTMTVTSGAGIHIQGTAATIPVLTNITIWNGYDGFWCDACAMQANNINFQQQNTAASGGHPSRYGLYLDSSTGTGPSSVIITNSSFTTQSPHDATNGLHAGIKIGASDGIQISNSFANGQNGINMQTNGTSPLNDIYLDNMIVDDVNGFGISMSGATPSGKFVGNIRIVNSHVWAYSSASGTSTEGIDIAGGGGTPQVAIVANNNVGGFGADCIRIGGGSVDTTVSGNTVANCQTAGIGAVTGATRPVIVGNKATNFSGGAFTMPEGILLDTTQNNITISNNDVSEVATPYGILSPGSITNLTGDNNNGFGQPTVASASSIQMPLTKTFSISGTTTITSVNSPWAAGTSGSLLTTGIVTFSSGSTIGNSITTAANQIYSWVWDGSKLWIK